LLHKQDIYNNVVFGFLQDSFVGMEQGPGYTVEVGYQKGAELARTNLVLSVVSVPGTASEQINASIFV
jgi:hypothetical protein